MSKLRDLKIRAHLDPAMNFRIRLYGIGSNDLGGNVVIDDVILKDHPTRFEHINSFLDIEKEQAQVLMDDLWNCGIRPSEGSGSAGSLAATERHLEDMRSIVFAKLAIEKKIR